MVKKILLLSFVSIVLPTSVLSQSDWKIFASGQFWGVYTLGATDSQGAVEDRMNLLLRRFRIGVDGKLSSKVSYRLNVAYDGIGKDRYTAVFGEQNNAGREFTLFDAVAQWDIEPEFSVVFGFFRPQVGRENITAPFTMASFEKMLTNFYVREALVGRANGRSVGAQVGGIYKINSGLSMQYHAGMFNPEDERLDGRSGRNFSPLWAGRLSVSVGDAEVPSYRINYPSNGWMQRKGVTVSVNGGYQGKTNPTVESGKFIGGHDQNMVYGADILLNFGAINFDAEYDVMSKSFSQDFVQNSAGVIRATSYSDRVWHVRAGYMIPIADNQALLELTSSYSQFTGDAASVLNPQGSHTMAWCGANIYLDQRRWKISLQYGFFDGEASSRFTRDGKAKQGDVIGIGTQFQIQ